MGEGLPMADDGKRAFGFSGTWRDYAPIAFTNLLLTIVTLGVYRFRATTRTRRYLWSRTRFVDEPLEWGGTGLELLIGFLIVLVVLGPPFLFLNFGMQALIFQGHVALAFGIGFVAFAIILYMSGLASFRMLRYRLSQTWWHGIRGGSNDKGWAYGWSYIWRNFVGAFPAYLLMPWAMISLWNERWNAMSFGPFAFRGEAESGGLYKRFLIFYQLPFLLVIGAIALPFLFDGRMKPVEPGSEPSTALLLFFMVVPLTLFLILPLIALAFYSKFLRVAVDGLSLATLDFRFTARTKDWFKLVLGDVALVILTLGIGAIFLAYRHWKFFIDHLDATGEISLSELTQSTTAAPGQGEGLADAFDMGAF